MYLRVFTVRNGVCEKMIFQGRKTKTPITETKFQKSGFSVTPSNKHHLASHYGIPTVLSRKLFLSAPI